MTLAANGPQLNAPGARACRSVSDIGTRSDPHPLAATPGLRYNTRTIRKLEIQPCSGRHTRRGSASLSAVYRNLASLAAAGFVSVSAAPGETTRRYRLAGHGPCAHHLHFACVRCGRIAHLPEAQTRKVSRLLHAEGLSLDLAKTLMQGTCPACRREASCAAL